MQLSADLSMLARVCVCVCVCVCSNRPYRANRQGTRPRRAHKSGQDKAGVQRHESIQAGKAKQAKCVCVCVCVCTCICACRYIAEQSNKYNLAYLHMIEPRADGEE